MSDSVRTQRWQATRLPHPWDFPGKNTGVGCHFLLQCMKVKVKSLSRVRLLAISWAAAYQAPLSMGFSRQESWSGVPSPSPKNENSQVKSHHLTRKKQTNKLYCWRHDTFINEISIVINFPNSNQKWICGLLPIFREENNF